MFCEKIFVGDATQHWKKVFHTNTLELLFSTFCRCRWLLDYYYFLEHSNCMCDKTHERASTYGTEYNTEGAKILAKASVIQNVIPNIIYRNHKS